MEKLCVFGGHYGSEGKGAAAEFHIHRLKERNGRKIAAFGENSPNSGHTCSAGKTKNIPASSFFANVVVLGPDAVIDPEVLAEDLQAVRLVNQTVEVYVHENAAFMSKVQKGIEQTGTLVDRIGSTASGSGKARCDKYFQRSIEHSLQDNASARLLLTLGVRIVNSSQWMHLVKELLSSYDWVFECSQGVLLDTNFGRYPFVTSRTTLPQAAIARNGLSMFSWKYVGVYRTFPIRTGGNSGPTGGAEVTFESIGVEKEIATVTKRIRRVFKFSGDDFRLSISLTQPAIVMFTHCDYVPEIKTAKGLMHWLDDNGVDDEVLEGFEVWASHSPGQFKLARA